MVGGGCSVSLLPGFCGGFCLLYIAKDSEIFDIKMFWFSSLVLFVLSFAASLLPVANIREYRKT